MCPPEAACSATRRKSAACRHEFYLRMNPDRTLPWDWYPGTVPENVMLAPEAYVETTYSFLLCSSQRPKAIEIGAGSSIYLGVMFDLGPEARTQIGSYVLMN